MRMVLFKGLPFTSTERPYRADWHPGPWAGPGWVLGWCWAGIGRAPCSWVGQVTARRMRPAWVKAAAAAGNPAAVRRPGQWPRLGDGGVTAAGCGAAVGLATTVHNPPWLRKNAGRGVRKSNAGEKRARACACRHRCRGAPLAWIPWLSDTSTTELRHPRAEAPGGAGLGFWQFQLESPPGRGRLYADAIRPTPYTHPRAPMYYTHRVVHFEQRAQNKRKTVRFKLRCRICIPKCIWGPRPAGSS